MVLGQTINQWPKSYLKANFKVIEQDLYAYRLMKKTITDLLEQLDEAESFEPGLKATKLSDMYQIKEKNPNKSYIAAHNLIRPESNPTEGQALIMMHWEEKRKHLEQLLSATQYAEMIRRIKIIEYVLNRLENSSIGYEKQKAELIKARYFEQRLAPVGLAQEFHISLATVYKWSTEVVLEISRRLGFISE